jgi:hypothetical protein
VIEAYRPVLPNSPAGTITVMRPPTFGSSSADA